VPSPRVLVWMCSRYHTERAEREEEEEEEEEKVYLRSKTWRWGVFAWPLFSKQTRHIFKASASRPQCYTMSTSQDDYITLIAATSQVYFDIRKLCMIH